MAAAENQYLRFTLSVTVQVDPTDDELLDRYDRSTGPFSIIDVVRSEIRSNLESISYVRHISIT